MVMKWLEIEIYHVSDGLQEFRCLIRRLFTVRLERPFLIIDSTQSGFLLGVFLAVHQVGMHDTVGKRLLGYCIAYYLTETSTLTEVSNILNSLMSLLVFLGHEEVSVSVSVCFITR